MDKKELNITLSQDQLESLVGTAVSAAIGAVPQMNQGNQDRFDGTMASTVDTARAMRAVDFNKKLSQNKKDMVKVRIELIYREYIGKSVTVSVNGNTIKIPVDGQFYMISKAHNHQLQKKLNGVNRNIQRSNGEAPSGIAGISGAGDWGRVAM